MSTTASSKPIRRPLKGLDDDISVTDRAQNVDSEDPTEDEADYLHFFSFLGLQHIEIIPSADLSPINEPDVAFGVGSGFSMDVSLEYWRSRAVAVKSPRSSTVSSDRGRRMWTPSWLQSLYFELQIMSHKSLSTHPNIVRLLGISFANGPNISDPSPRLVVEAAHLEYPDLSRLLNRSNAGDVPISITVARNLIADVADGIEVLHNYTVVHGDVKPDNVLIFPRQDEAVPFLAKLCDFGFSGASVSADGPRGRTNQWAAPECLEGAANSIKGYADGPKQDVYSFGLVSAFILLKGEVASFSPSYLIQELRNAYGETSGESTDRVMVRDFTTILEECLRTNPSYRLSRLSKIRTQILG